MCRSATQLFHLSVLSVLSAVRVQQLPSLSNGSKHASAHAPRGQESADSSHLLLKSLKNGRFNTFQNDGSKCQFFNDFTPCSGAHRRVKPATKKRNEMNRNVKFETAHPCL
jgi:hypothetical protein